MPPTEKVSRTDIILAGLSVIAKEGTAALTARRVATELGVSTAPVYRNFDSMEDLAAAIMERARDQLLEYSTRPFTDRPFLNMGTGIAVFAREHPRLYRALFLESDQFESIVDEFLERLTEGMKSDSRFQKMPRARRAVLLHRMWTYTHGLASLIAIGLVDDTSDLAIIGSLNAVGRAVIRSTLEEDGEA
jgi:AcrR family transcriptional regulator